MKRCTCGVAVSQKNGNGGRDLPALSQCLSNRVNREEMYLRCRSVSENGNGERDLPAVLQCLSKKETLKGGDAPAVLQCLDVKKRPIYTKPNTCSSAVLQCLSRRCQWSCINICCLNMHPTMCGAKLELLISRICSGLFQMLDLRASDIVDPNRKWCRLCCNCTVSREISESSV